MYKPDEVADILSTAKAIADLVTTNIADIAVWGMYNREVMKNILASKT